MQPSEVEHDLEDITLPVLFQASQQVKFNIETLHISTAADSTI